MIKRILIAALLVCLLPGIVSAEYFLNPVGIGTDNPEQMLHIYKPTLGSYVQIEAGDASPARLMFSNNEGQSHIDNNNGLLRFATAGTTNMVIDDAGKVGIGTTAPKSKLHVADSTYYGSDDKTLLLLAPVASLDPNVANSSRLPTSLGAIGWSINSSSNPFAKIDAVMDDPGLNCNSTLVFSTINAAVNGGTAFEKMRITSDGKVGVGTMNPQSKLSVNGTITAKEVKVTSSGWSDFVFADDYQLRSLESVAAYIEKNNHLPDIPSGAEIEQGGIAVSEMLAKQMQKIEELTLYVIELEEKAKRVDSLEARLAALESKL